MSLLKYLSRRSVGTLALAGLTALTLSSVSANAATPDEIKARDKHMVGVLTD